MSLSDKNPETIQLSLLFQFIKPFNGDRDNLTPFIQNGNSAFSLANTNQKNQLFLYAVSQLSNNVVNELNFSEIKDWTTLKEHLKRYYGYSKDLSQLYEELETIKQYSNESVSDYFKRLDKLKSQCISAEVSNNEDETHLLGIKVSIQNTALRRFIIHTKPEISQMLRARDIKTLTEALPIAVQEEKVLNSRKQFPQTSRNSYHNPQTFNRKRGAQFPPRPQKPPFKSDKSCNYCKNPGHTIDECRKRQFQNQYRQSDHRINQVNSTNYNSAKSEKFCNYCKSYGHLIETCRRRPNNDQTREVNRKISHLKLQQPSEDECSFGGRNNCSSIRPKHEFVSVLSPKQAHEELISINFTSKNSKNKKLSFLIDTGATISLIKHDPLDPSITKLNTAKTVTIDGINPNASVQSIGLTQVELKIGELILNPKMHLINSNKISCDTDGILGNDFLKSEGVNIDYERDTIKIHNHIIPFKNELEKANFIKLSPCSENIIEISIENDAQEGIFEDISLTNSINLFSSYVKNNNGSALCVVSNESYEELFVQQPLVKLQQLDESNAMCLKFNHSDPERKKKLKENLRLDHLSKPEKDSIIQICQEHSDIFFLPGDKLTASKTEPLSIPTTSNNPVTSKMYRYPKIHEAEVKNQVNELLDQGIIQPSTSPWNSPVWVVPKKADASGLKKWRMVIDYRGLNDLIVTDKYPLPSIEHILDQLGEAKYFTTLDLASGFHQIEINPDDRAKTAFSIPGGHFEFNRLGFGIKNGPPAFQRRMDNTLRGLPAWVFLDDIIIPGKSLEDHNKNLTDVFSRLRSFNFKLQPDKCEFLGTETNYLGHIITDKGIMPNPNKIKAISEIKRPKGTKDIKSFLGLVGYYRKFIPSFSQIAKPLNKLLAKDQKFNWDDKCEESFTNLKNILITEPILQYPNFEKTFILTTDASNEAIGSVLSQGKIGEDLPIAYYSRTLNKAECNYSTSEKELLSIVDSVKHFRPYLFGQKFTIVTDHKPLTWLMNCKDPSSRLVRWRLKLLEYDYEIVYKQGKLNRNADALSRPILTITTDSLLDDFTKFKENSSEPKIFQTESISKENAKTLILPMSCDGLDTEIYFDYIQENFPNTKLDDHKVRDVLLVENKNQKLYIIFIKQFAIDQPRSEDIIISLNSLKSLLEQNKTRSSKTLTIPDLSKLFPSLDNKEFLNILNFLFSDFTIKILKNEIIDVNDPEMIKDILRTHHDDILSGHQGVDRTFLDLKGKYYWPNMRDAVIEYIKKCPTCQKAKTNFKPHKSPMVITTTSQNFCERVALDIVGPLNETENGNRFVLSLQDDLTKFVQFYAIPEHTAVTVSIYFLKFCTQFGFPESILTDQGSEFTSKTLKELNKILSIDHKFSSPYHPQTNGSLEKTHLSLKDFLKCYVNEDKNDWDKFLNFAAFSYNSHIQKSTQNTPYELVFGQLPRIPNKFRKPSQNKTYTDLSKEIMSKLQTLRRTAHENQKHAKASYKKNYDKTHKSPNPFQSNQYVLLYNMLAKKNFKKLDHDYKGPYKIIAVHENNTATLEITKNKFRTYHFNMLKPYVSGQDK